MLPEATLLLSNYNSRVLKQQCFDTKTLFLFCILQCKPIQKCIKTSNKTFWRRNHTPKYWTPHKNSIWSIKIAQTKSKLQKIFLNLFLLCYLGTQIGFKGIASLHFSDKMQIRMLWFSFYIWCWVSFMITRFVYFYFGSPKKIGFLEVGHDTFEYQYYTPFYLFYRHWKSEYFENDSQPKVFPFICLTITIHSIVSYISTRDCKGITLKRGISNFILISESHNLLHFKNKIVA